MVKAFLFLGTLFALAALAWMAFLPAFAERELRAVTGFDIRVPILAANPFTGRLYVQGMTAKNPHGYPAPDFVEVHSLQADVDVYSLLFGDQLVIGDLDLNVGTLDIIRLHDGRSNVGECVSAFSPPKAPGAAAAPPGKPLKYIVKRFHIRMERLVIEDYTGFNADKRIYNLNIDHTYTNVTDPRQLLVPDVVRTLYSFGLHHDAARLLPGDFGVALADAVDGVANVGSKVKDASHKAGEYLKGLFDKLEQSPKP
jgi:hypothetical protein